MSFEGHSLTSAEISHLAQIHSVSSPRLVLRLLDVIYVFLFLLESGEPGRSGSRGSRAVPDPSGGGAALELCACAWCCCCARVSSLAAGTRTGSLPSLEPGLPDGSPGCAAGDEGAALEAGLIFEKVYLHFR